MPTSQGASAKAYYIQRCALLPDSLSIANAPIDSVTVVRLQPNIHRMVYKYMNLLYSWFFVPSHGQGLVMQTQRGASNGAGVATATAARKAATRNSLLRICMLSLAASNERELSLK